MPVLTAAVLDSLQTQFTLFVQDPLDYTAFYAWRAQVERVLKIAVSDLLQSADVAQSVLSSLEQQFSQLPSQWQSEIVAIRVRVGLLSDELRQITEPAAIRLLRVLEGIERSLSKISGEFQEGGGMHRIPEVVLSSRTSLDPGSPLKQRHDLKASEIRDLFRACKTPSSLSDLSHSLVNSFYAAIQRRNPDEIKEFLLGIREILIPLQKKLPTNQVFLALLDTFPYLLFFGHRAPYDEKFIECSRLLGDLLLEVMDHPAIEFRGKDYEGLDETVHYLFHTLFYSLEQGRLAAFMDLFKVTLEILNQSSKFELKYFYIPIVSEMFYWIPAAYKDKIRQFMLDDVRARIQLKANSPLRPLFELVGAGSGQDLDKFIVVGEFLKEVYQDGKVSDLERNTLRDLLKALDVTPLEYRRVLREVMREFRNDEIRSLGNFDKNQLMLRLLKLAMANQEVDPQEKSLLHTAARVLGIDRQTFGSLLKRLEREKTHPESEGYLEKGFRRLGWGGVSKALLKSLEWYKWNQMKLEVYQRAFEDYLQDSNYSPTENHFHCRNEVADYFSPLSGEVKVTSFADESTGGKRQEIGVMIFSPRRLLRKWFEIAAQVDYLLVDSTATTFSVEFYLVNLMGSIMMTRNIPIQDPELFKRLVKENRGRYRLFIVEEETKKLVYWQKVSSYLIEKRKIEPLMDALEARNFTSIKIISQIGQKKDPDEVIYYHAMIANTLSLGSNQDETLRMIELCKSLIVDKFPHDFKLYYYLGCLYFEIGKSQEAYHWLAHSIQIKPDYKDALYLYCEKKLMDDVLNPQALGYLKFLDLCFAKEERLKSLYLRLQKKHQVALQPLIARARLMTNTQVSRNTN